MNTKKTVVAYVVDRLAQLGITACYIEVVTGEHDYPPGARVLHARYAELYEVKPG